MAMQMQQKQIELQERQTQVAEMKVDGCPNRTDEATARTAESSEPVRYSVNQMDLKEAQLEHKQFVDNEELKIARTADDVRAYFTTG